MRFCNNANVATLDSLSICIAGALCVRGSHVWRNMGREISSSGSLFPVYLRLASALSYWLYVGLIRGTSDFAQMHNEDALIAMTSESSPTKPSRVIDNVQLLWIEMFPHYDKYVLLWHRRRLKIVRDRFFMTRPQSRNLSSIISLLLFYFYYSEHIA